MFGVRAETSSTICSPCLPETVIAAAAAAARSLRSAGEARSTWWGANGPGAGRGPRKAAACDVSASAFVPGCRSPRPPTLALRLCAASPRSRSHPPVPTVQLCSLWYVLRCGGPGRPLRGARAAAVAAVPPPDEYRRTVAGGHDAPLLPPRASRRHGRGS